MRILDRYIFKNVINAILLVMLIVTAIQSFLGFAAELADIGKGNYDFLHALTYILMQLPYNLYQVFPMIGFVGCLIGMGKLSSSSELVIIRSVGVSIKRIIWSVIKSAFAIIVVMMLIGGWIGPLLNAKSEALKLAAISTKSSMQTAQNIWLRQGDRFIRIHEMPDAHHIKQIAIFHFQKNHQLKTLAYAEKGVLKNGVWQLFDVDKTLFLKKIVQIKHMALMQLPLNINPSLIAYVTNHINTDEDTILELLKKIKVRNQIGLLSNSLQLNFWQRLIQPFTTIVMICLGIPFVFGSLRSASLGLRVMVGCIIGFSFYILNRIFGPIVIVYQVPPLLGAVLPTVFFMIAYLLMARRVR